MWQWLLGGVCMAGSVFGQMSRPPLTLYERQAFETLHLLVQTHPQALVSKKLNNWVSGRLVKISFFTQNSMAAALAEDNGKEIVVLFVNADFVNYKGPADGNGGWKHKQLAVYHESVHIDDHFSGRIRLPKVGYFPTPAEAPKHADLLWRAEYHAMQEEWNLAKKFDAPQLMPTIQRAVAKYGEEKGFFEGAHELLIESAKNTKRAPMIPYLEKIYAREKTKYLPRKK